MSNFSPCNSTKNKPTISVEPYDSETEPEIPIRPHMKATKSCAKRIKPCPSTPKRPKKDLDNTVMVKKVESPLKTEKGIKLMSQQFKRRLGISNSKKSL